MPRLLLRFQVFSRSRYRSNRPAVGYTGPDRGLRRIQDRWGI